MILAVMDSKYDSIISILSNKVEKKDSHENNMNQNQNRDSHDSNTNQDRNGDSPGSNANQNQNEVVQTCIARLNFPKFSGGEPRFCIYRANQFFKYRKKSEEHKVLLTNRVEGSPTKVFFGCFIGRPTEEIAAEITMLKPTNISMAIGLAPLPEEKL